MSFSPSQAPAGKVVYAASSSGESRVRRSHGRVENGRSPIAASRLYMICKESRIRKGDPHRTWHFVISANRGERLWFSFAWTPIEGCRADFVCPGFPNPLGCSKQALHDRGPIEYWMTELAKSMWLAWFERYLTLASSCPSFRSARSRLNMTRSVMPGGRLTPRW